MSGIIKKDETTQYPQCPYCGKNRHIAKIGHRSTKRGIMQRYRCNICNKTFTETPLKHAQYPPKIIFFAISSYNLGHTKRQVTEILSKKFNADVPIPTIHSWLKRFQDVCTIAPLRKRYSFKPLSIIKSKKLHHVQVYNFKYHDLKLNLAAKKFPSLRKYIRDMYESCPNELFKKEGPRCSSLRIEIKPRKIPKANNAPKLANFGTTLARSSKSHHQKVEDFMLINDSATIATEIPVFVHPNELTKTQRKIIGLDIKRTLTGHIDILQVRFDRIHVLDYKPDTKKDDKRAAEQVFLYTLALSKRTGIPLSEFTCAYFDDKNYFQFSPMPKETAPK
jgi:transposase-like protein